MLRYGLTWVSSQAEIFTNACFVFSTIIRQPSVLTATLCASLGWMLCTGLFRVSVPGVYIT